jgi:hypothetical protein
MKTKGAHNVWIGVDLDGTLAHYDTYKGDDFVGAPIKPMVNKVKQWLKEGKDVRIFTARKPHPAIRRFSMENFGKVLPITSVKDPGMIALYDDRAVSVKRNKGVVFSEESEEQVHAKS